MGCRTNLASPIRLTAPARILATASGLTPVPGRLNDVVRFLCGLGGAGSLPPTGRDGLVDVDAVDAADSDNLRRFGGA